MQVDGKSQSAVKSRTGLPTTMGLWCRVNAVQRRQFFWTVMRWRSTFFEVRAAALSGTLSDLFSIHFFASGRSDAMHFLNHRHTQFRRLCAALGCASTGGSAVDGCAVLDEAALGRLRDLDPTGANQLMSRVLTAFEASLTRLMPQLTQAQGSQDCKVIRHVAHTLKSSSASVGALHLSKLCAELEAAARAAELDGMDERINSMRAETDVVMQALKQSLATQT
jgi:HPt (histidine-containing phosphotransfer) domain-containing protein